MTAADIQILIDSFILLFLFWHLFKLAVHVSLREVKAYLKREHDKRVWSRLRG